MPKFKVRITTDEDMVIEADDEEAAGEEAWNLMFERGAYGQTVEEVDDDVSLSPL